MKDLNADMNEKTSLSHAVMPRNTAGGTSTDPSASSCGSGSTFTLTSSIGTGDERG